MTLQKKRVWEALKSFLSSKNITSIRAQSSELETAETKVAKNILLTERKNMKEICRTKKKQWFEERWKKVKESRTMTEWWEAIGKFRVKRRRAGEGIKKEQWVEHFAKLLGEKSNAGISGGNATDTGWEKSQGESDDPRMDAEIAVHEVIRALKDTKNKKAPGEDGITVEFIKGMPKTMGGDLTRILNQIWNAGEMPKGWEEANIYPILKAGEEGTASNYRGISLLNIGYKLLASVMAKRVNAWIEGNKILRESQAGFRPGRGTRDHVFVLNSLINNKLKNKAGKLYVAFVDFRAAFDKLDREVLLQKLWEKGIRGHMHRMIRGIYKSTRNAVITSEGMSDLFETENGVRQGCPLSPTLFNLALDDVDEGWERKNEGGTVVGGIKIFALKYADDIAIVADDAEGLRKMLKSLEKFVHGAKMEVNIKKTKVMIFKNGGREGKKREKWMWRGEKIEIVKEFKYLGYWFTPKNTGSGHIRYMVQKARKAINSVWGVLKRARVDELKERLQLYDSLANAGALYGIEIWGWQRREEIEKLQGKLAKMALGVARNTPSYLWKLEAGRRSVEVVARRRASKYLLEVLKMEEGRWPKVCLKEEIRSVINGNPSRWGKDLTKALREVGDGRTCRLVWASLRWPAIGMGGQVEKCLAEGCCRKEEQDIQKDWTGVEKSSFCPWFKDIKEGCGRERYWDNKTIRGELKEQWARLRCGNVGKVGKKGFESWTCEVCRNAEESVEHIWQCEEARMMIKEEWIRGVDEWRKGREGEELERWTRVTLRGELVEEICEYVREFEKAKRARTENEMAARGAQGGSEGGGFS